MITFVPLLSREQMERPPERAREVVEYRKRCPFTCVTNAEGSLM